MINYDKKYYEVIVGNIGKVHEGNSKAEALKIYNEYVKMSKDGYGRAAGEGVDLYNSGNDIIKSHAGRFEEFEEFEENPRKRKSYGGEARKVFDNYNAARQSESEAYLRTPKGEAERKARNAAMLARMRAKRNPEIHVDINSHNQREAGAYMKNPTTRAVTLDDMNTAIRGLRMNSLDGDELRELIALHKDSEMFVGQVTAAAARHVLKSKQRVGLIRNPRKRTPAQRAATARMLAANRAQNARRFPAAKSLTGTIAKIRRMHKNPKSAAPKSNRITVSHCAPGATHYGAIAFFPNDAKGQKHAIDYAKNLKKKNKSHSFKVTK